MNKKGKTVIGVDLGNHNTKTDRKKIFRSAFEEFDYKHEILNDDVIIYNGKKYVIGKGGFDNTKVKSEKKNTIPLLLNAIYQSIESSYLNLRIIVGLPLEHHKNKSLVKEIKDMYTGLFEFKYVSGGNVVDVIYDIKEVFVFPECLGAFYSLHEDMTGRDVLLVDIGGGTVNIALFSDGEYEDSTTIQEGTNDLYRQITARANFINTGASFDVEHILKFMQRGKIKWDGKIDNMEYVDEIIGKFSNEVVNKIKGKFPLYKSYEIMLSGGGVDLLKDDLSKDLKFDIIKDNIFANAIGFYNVGADIDE